MAGTITHRWDGTTLIVTSDSGTSACDLKGSTGDMGIRGPQGIPGIGIQGIQGIQGATGAKIISTTLTGVDANGGNIYTQVFDDGSIAQFVAPKGEGVATLKPMVETNTKRIENLEARLTDSDFTTDSAIAYEKTVPADAAPYAEINKIGGMTHVIRRNNLIKVSPAFDVSLQGADTTKATLTLNADGDLHIVGESTYDDNYNYAVTGIYPITFDIDEAGTYTISTYWKDNNGMPVVPSMVVDINEGEISSDYIYDYGGDNIVLSYTFTISAPSELSLNLWFGDLWDGHMDFTIKTMLNKGSTALPWESPKVATGMFTTPVTKLESIGKNLLDISKGANDNFKDNGDGTYTMTRTSSGRFSNKIPIFIPANTEARIYGKILSYSNSTYNFAQLQFFKANGNSDYTVPMRAQSLQILSTDSDIVGVRYFMDSNTAVGDYVTFSEPQIELGTTSTDYAPYSAEPIDTFEIPSDVQALPGYGEGINASCNNYIEYQNERVIYKRDLETVVLTGDETRWTEYASTDTIAKYWTSDFDDIFKDKALAMSNKFTRANGSISEVGLFVISNGSSKVCFGVSKSQYPTIDDWRNQLREWNNEGNPLTVTAQAKKPEVIDITHLMPSDNFLKVQGNGKIFAVNDFSNGAPTTITYQKEG